MGIAHGGFWIFQSVRDQGFSGNEFFALFIKDTAVKGRPLDRRSTANRWRLMANPLFNEY